MLIECVLLLLIGILSCILIWKHYSFYWQRRNIPYIKPTWPFGNIADIIKMDRTIGEVYDDIYWQLKGEPFGGFFRFWKPALMLRDPELIKAVFVKEFKCFLGNDYYVDPDVDPILGLNPFNCVGENWIKARTILTPSLTPHKIKGMVPSIVEVCENMKKHLVQQEGNFLEGYDFLGKYTTDVIARIAFGLNMNSFEDPNSRLRVISSQMFETGVKGNIALICALYAPRIGKRLKFKIFSEEVNKYFMEIIKDITEHRIQHNIKRNDYLQTLIDKHLEQKGGNKEGYNYQEMAAHCMTFFLDGFETTCILMSFVLYELSLNKHIENKLRGEIKKVGNRLSDFDYEKVHQIEYLKLVILETLRKHPPGTTMARLCNKTVTLKSGDKEVTIEEGMSVTLPMYSLHNDPTYFPDPETFDPLRFKADGNRPEFCYFPFGGGPRSCPGYMLALTFIKLGIIAILLDYTLEPKSKEKGKLELNPMNQFFHSAKNGLWVKYVKFGETYSQMEEVKTN